MQTVSCTGLPRQGVWRCQILTMLYSPNWETWWVESPQRRGLFLIPTEARQRPTTRLGLGSSLEKFHLLGYHTHLYLPCSCPPSTMCTFACKCHTFLQLHFHFEILRFLQNFRNPLEQLLKLSANIQDERFQPQPLEEQVDVYFLA